MEDFLSCKQNINKIFFATSLEFFLSKKNIFPCGIYTYIRTFVVEQEFLNLVMDVDGDVGGNGCLFPKKFIL
jgi:hypothetical protein